MENHNELDIATTLGRIWCEELVGIIESDDLQPQDGYEIIKAATCGDWITYLMGNEIQRDFNKISQIVADYYGLDSLPSGAVMKIVGRVQTEYK